MNQPPWPRIRLKYTCQVNPPAPRVADDQHVTFVPMESVGERGGISTDSTRPGGAVRQGYTGFRDGDVVVAKITPCFENGKGSIVEGMLGGVGFGTTELHVLRAKDSDRRWLFYLTQSKHFMGLGEGSMYGAGGQKRVPADFIRNYEAWTPPLPTQKAIAAFLDRKTAAIDALIEKKQKLLDLLAEKRAALINQAVTKGLDPHVPMKDSGVRWIGEIPAHWEVKRLKFLVREAFAGPYGASLTKAMYSSSGYRVYGQQQVIPDDFTVGDYYISPEKFAEMRRYLVHPGDVLVSVMGTVGRVAVVPENAEPGIINPRLVRYAPDTSLILPRFMQAAMLAECSQAYLRLMAQGATMDGLNMGTLAELALPVPPLREQEAILVGLRRRTAGVDGATSSLTRQLDRIQEYRQALITAAVTGQLDILEDRAA